MLRFCVRIIGGIFAIGFLSLGSLSCSQEVEQVDRVDVRISVESQLGKTGIVRVFVEGPQGQIASGAVVTATTFRNQVVRVPFDTEEWCHRGSIVLPLDSKLRISVRTLLAAGNLDFSIPHRQPARAPAIIMLQDSQGVSAFAGGTPDSTKDIQVAWEQAGTDVVYLISIKTALATVYSSTTEETSLIIPAGILTAGESYFASVQAQIIEGDPYFQNASYCSVSMAQGAQIGFSLASAEKTL